MKYYTTSGRVRGDCDHMHRSERTAIACVQADSNACAKQGGYSDRIVHVVENGAILPVDRDWNN